MRRNLLIFAALFAAGLGLVFAAPALLVDPGPLIKGHEKLAGDCFKCHTPLLGPRDGKCIACHKVSEIGARKPEKARFHQRLAEQNCTACHTDHVGLSANRPTRTFEHRLLQPPWRQTCHDCHTPPKDTLHRQIAADCQTCHAPTGWRPATFDHSRYFRFDRHHPADCATCHVGGHYDRYTCYECHEHSEAKIREEHLEEGIRDFRNCAECHRSGDEDEAERIWKAKRQTLPGWRGGRDDD